MAEIRVEAHVLKQNDYTLYSFVLNSRALKKISYALPRTTDNPEEIQRIKNTSRCKEIGEYVRKPDSVLPNSIVVNLSNEVRIEPTAQPERATVVFPTEDGRYAYLLDGQHRVGGFEHSQGVEFDLPICALHNVPDQIAGKVFADINSKQEKVSDVHLLDLYYQLKALPQDDAAVMDIVGLLSTDEDSPIKGRVKTMPGQKGFWIKNTFLKMILQPYIGKGGILSQKTSAQQAIVFKAYLNALKQLFPEAWGSKKHVLTKAMGLEIIMSVFRDVVMLCHAHEGGQLTVETFKRQLRPVVGAKIALLGRETPLDWSSEVFSKLSNKPAKTEIKKELTTILTRELQDKFSIV
ncbi:MAG: DGQHR domain-containing protein [Terriglobales bacterium]